LKINLDIDYNTNGLDAHIVLLLFIFALVTNIDSQLKEVKQVKKEGQ
jgi:hypothetical protein